MPFDLKFRGPARRALSEALPESIAVAAYEFCIGPLAENPLRVTRELGPPLGSYRSARRGTYRVVCTVDEAAKIVYVEWIDHRSDVYRSR